VVDDLQSLLERIQKDGFDRATAEADRILAEAEQKAQRIIAEADQQAAALLAAGERDAKAFMDRAVIALEQTVRDYLLRIQRSLEALFLESVRGDLSEALTPELMAELVAKLVESYSCAITDAHTDLYLTSADRDRFVDLFMSKYRQMIARGVEIHVDDRLRKGFRISFGEDHVYHDFTLEALAESVAAMLRPPLKDIVRRAVASPTASEG
jgi:V/A-type H+-transporting ATPase subunit E